MKDLESLTKATVKAIAYAENGGKPDINHPKAGKTGEAKSIFQFTPATWKGVSKKYFGKEVPITADNETYVMSKRVSDWIKQGKTLRQIASMHNAGEGEPDAYTGKFSDGSPSKGINKKYKVSFDVPGYADKVLKYSKEFYQKESPTTMNTQKPENSSLQSILSTIKGASSTGNTVTSRTPAIAAAPVSKGLLMGSPKKGDNEKLNSV